MNKFVVIVVSDEKKAYQAVKGLEALHNEGSVTVYDTVVVEREASGQLKIKQREEAPVGFGVGSLLGGMIGVFGGPAGALAGLAIGGVTGGWRDLLHAEVSDEFLEKVQKDLAPGKSAVVAEVAEEWAAPIDTRMQALGATIIREPREAFVDDLLEKRADARKAELNDWKAKHAGKKVERLEGNLAEEIEEARRKLQSTAEKARERLDHTKEEMEQKLTALQEQAAKANPDVRERVQQRIADLRRDFEEREKRLTRAYELTQEALQP